MALLALPIELIDCIVHCLASHSDISTFSRVNRHLYRSLTGYLYRRDAQERGSSALLWAAERGNPHTAQKSITHGGNILAQSADGLTPLLMATSNGHLPLVQLLLDTGPTTLDLMDRSGRTPLSYAARNGHSRTVKFLVERGASLNDRDCLGETPLFKATTNGFDEVVEILLGEADIDPQANDNKGRTSLLQAPEKGHVALVELLLVRDYAHINHRDNAGQFPLSLAVSNGHVEVVRKLLASEPSPTLEAPGGRHEAPQSMLSLAAGRGHLQVVRLLLQSVGVDPDCRDIFGDSALMVAAGNFLPHPNPSSWHFLSAASPTPQ